VEKLTAARLFEEQQADLELEALTESLASRRDITVADVHRPGMALMGFVENFLPERIQILGQTEIWYLSTLADAARDQAIDRLFKYPIPCIIVSKALDIPPRIVQLGNEQQVPVLRTSKSTTPFIHQLTAYLDVIFAPQTTVHGSLVDVYGVGLLFTGRSAIGKSECALDLVERGHRLVADDVVFIKRRGMSVLIGYGNQMLQHHMEIRGVGIIDLATLFGIRAVRMRKRIEVEVRLKRWSDDEDYDRLGLDEKPTTILDAEIPLVTVPVIPGKNISVVAEVIAMNFLLRVYGYRTPEEFNRRLQESMQKKFEAGRFEDEDTE